jgi:flagellar basal body P-ring formation chaperone FlgA
VIVSASFKWRALRAWLTVSVLAPAALAAAPEPREVRVETVRVELADVMASCPELACKMDLGPAPPPGTSWLVDAAVIRGALESAGEDPRHFGELRAVRVTSAARVLSPAELGELARPSIERELPPGVRLTGVEAKAKAVVPLLGVPGAATLPKLPKRAGPTTTTAMVDILLDGTLVRRVPVLVRLSIDASAARPDVPRGHVLTLVIERRSATISTDGVALRDAAIGEVAPFKVQRTGRVINARVKSAGVAQVLEVD